MTQRLAHLPATELAEGYRNGLFSVSEVVEDVLSTIESADVGLNAYCVVDPDHARTSAAEADARFAAGAPMGLLDGVPVSIKDILLTEEWSTRRGSRALPALEPSGVDSPSAKALRRAGAVTVGKTTTPELGWKGVTDSPLTGVTRNPWNHALTPGGSSGGAAVAVATGMGAIAVGTDGGGSVRIPAAFTGVVGFKPSRGMVPLWPASAFGLLSHVGPLTRTVDDAILAMSVLGRPDIRDTSFPHDRYASLDPTMAPLPLTGLRVGFALEHRDVSTDPDVRRILERALLSLQDQGARLKELDLPLAGVGEAFRTLWFVGAAAATRPAEGTSDGLDPGLAAVAVRGANFSAVQYHEAILRRETLMRDTHELFESIDVLVTPTVPILPFEAGLEVPAGWTGDGWSSWTPFTWPFNLTGQPAISVPAGLSQTGLPVGLQAVCRFGADEHLLRFAKSFEALRGALQEPPSTHR
jgi:aspartyl-tRNA(Asn)/glutamyl-tRNA(Gln) amidotransferase subunit A